MQHFPPFLDHKRYADSLVLQISDSLHQISLKELSMTYHFLRCRISTKTKQTV